jgi:hypothetical protein
VDLPVAHYGTGVPAGNATIVTIRRSEPGGPPRFCWGRSGAGDRSGRIEAACRGIPAENQASRDHQGGADIPHGFVQEVTRVVNDIEGTVFNIGVQDKR